MENLKGIKVQYTHPAVPLPDINIGWIYTVGINKKGLYIDDGNLEMPIDIGSLKCLFTPLGYSWQDLEILNTKKTKETK